MVRITISGHPGSGTSTLVGVLCDHYGWGSLNGGDVFRSVAEERGVSLAEFGTLCATDESVDRSLDEFLRMRMREAGGPDIVESRLAGWWAYLDNLDCIRLWIDVDPEERARRVTLREGQSLEEALSQNKERASIDLSRYESMYGISPDDPTPYTHTIDATSLSVEEVLHSVIGIMEA